jgi:MATE family multidrug resistance protein
LGLASYASVFVAQHHGAGRPDRIGPCVRQSILLSLLSGAAVFGLSRLLAPILAALGHAPELAALERRLFLILSGGSVFTLVGASLSCFWTGRGRAWTVALVSLASIALNVALNALLIFGSARPGLPAMGLAGAAWATTLSKAAKTTVSAAMFWSAANRRRYATAPRRLAEPAVLRQLVRRGFDHGFQLLSGIEAMAVFNLAAGRCQELAAVGTDGGAADAAMTSAFSLSAAAAVPAAGLGAAPDPATLRLAGRLTCLAGLFFAAETLTPLYGGAIRGAGDSGYAMKAGATTAGALVSLALPDQATLRPAGRPSDLPGGALLRKPWPCFTTAPSEGPETAATP